LVADQDGLVAPAVVWAALDCPGGLAVGAGFIGYAVLFLVRNFTDSFLELGIGPGEVSVGKDQIQQFSPSLYYYLSLSAPFQ
jgi:hypothetical protein